MTELAVHRVGAQRMGFFTDTTVCIGCKACEVACKQWNDLPADGPQSRKGGSYDHTGELSASTWRHVRFVELLEPSAGQREEAAAALARGEGGGIPRIPAAALADAGGGVAERRSPTSSPWPVSGRRRRAVSTSPLRWPTWIAGSSCPTCASTARTPAASTRARPAR